MRATALPRSLETAIREQLTSAKDAPVAELFEDSLDDEHGLPVALKYVPAKYGRQYATPGGALHVSTTPGFTWGTGTYVAPLKFPLTGAIFGRIGVAARFDPSRWNIFDATDKKAQALYIDWVRFQPLARPLMLTMHSQLANQFLRDLFRTMFEVDCVLFPPDQANVTYTGPDDVWMCVTDWQESQREISRGPTSSALGDPLRVIVIEEEFEAVFHDVGRATLIGPLGPLPPLADLQAAIRAAYAGGPLVHLTS